MFRAYEYYNNNITQRTDARGVVTNYDWDALNRLTSIEYPSTSNRLIEIDSTALTYDSAGNLISYDTNDYTWNAAGQLEEVEISSSTVGTYTYDPQNRRIKKVAGGNTVHYVYGMGGLLYGEYDNSGNLIREYVYLNPGLESGAGSEPLAQIDAGTPEVLTYLHTDHLGTPRYGTDTGGNQVWTWDYDAFGNEAPTGSRTVNLRMPGQYYDAESGLFYNWNRYYNPATGRYISSDPIGLDGGLNTYNYAMANPVMYSDPEGQMSESGLLYCTLGPNPICTTAVVVNCAKWTVITIGGMTALACAADLLDCPWISPNTADEADEGTSTDSDSSSAEEGEDDPKRPDCRKASKWDLQQAGILGREHEYKEEHGARPYSKFDICKCKDGTIRIAPVKMCGKTSNFWGE